MKHQLFFTFLLSLLLSSALVWGLNRSHEPGEAVRNGHSLLAETNWQMPWYSFSARAEWVQKSEAELTSDEVIGHGRLNNISALTLGISRYLFKGRFCWMDLGVAGTAYAVPEALQSEYGRAPYSLEIALRIVPPRMEMEMK